MKRLISLLLLVGLGAASIAPPVAAKEASHNPKARKDEAKYQGSPTIFMSECAHYSKSTCVMFQTSRQDAFISLEIVDETGLPIAGFIWHRGRRVGSFCGDEAAAAPVPIRGGRPVMVWLSSGLTPVGCASAPTQGTVTATFTSADKR